MPEDLAYKDEPVKSENNQEIANEINTCAPNAMKSNLKFLMLTALGVLCLCASAQNYSVDWYKIGGGGGTSTNGQYAVSGTIGQHEAGRSMRGGNYSLTAGFWSLISVVPSPGKTLYISRSGSMATLYWLNDPGWTLQQNSDVTQSAGWFNSSGVATSNGTNYLNITAPNGNLFFRLKQQ